MKSCKECGKFLRHAIGCSEMSCQEAKEQLATYYSLYKKAMALAEKTIDFDNSSAQKWREKFHQVKHENNKLRKKIYNK